MNVLNIPPPLLLLAIAAIYFAWNGAFTAIASSLSTACTSGFWVFPMSNFVILAVARPKSC